MELLLGTVGPRHSVNKTLSDIEKLRLPFTFKKHDGKGFVNGTKRQYAMNPIVRPLQIYSIVFPEPCRDKMLTTILGQDPSTAHHSRKHNALFWALRKGLGLEPIPKYENNEVYVLKAKKGTRYIHRKDTHLIGLGLKNDRYEDGVEMI